MREIDFMNKKMNIFLFMDITQVQKSEQRKLEAKFKNIFLSSMSHNLKTPINSKYSFKSPFRSNYEQPDHAN
jgi:signal transduction histidine kinase